MTIAGGNVSVMSDTSARGTVSAMETVQGDPGTGAGMTIAGGNVSVMSDTSARGTVSAMGTVQAGPRLRGDDNAGG